MNNNDIKIDNIYENFKFRVNGILIEDDKILIVKIKENSFYCLPGGHVKIGEDTKNAIIREFKEETGYNTNIDRLINISENFFTRDNGKKIHELSFYYLLNLKDKEIIKFNEYDVIEEDDENIRLHFRWIPIKELENIEFRPQNIKQKIEEGNMDFSHIIIK